MAHTEDELLPISALQHFVFCPRQCALIHLEQAWSENRFTAEGRIMHEKVAKACLDHGQRVQNSVFECLVDPGQWAALKNTLLATYHEEFDSLRFYYLGSNWKRRVEHHGVKTAVDPEGPLIV